MLKIIHKIKKRVLLGAVFFVILNVVLINFALANPPYPGDSGGLYENPLGGTKTFAKLIGEVANAIMKVGIPVAVIFLIYAGLKFVTARGSEEELTKAKKTFTWAVVGAGILLGATVIAKAIETTINSLK
jgi:hypothetical protein